MGKLITANGTAYNSGWCGVSSIDGFLRFCVSDISMKDAMTVFSDEENTYVLHYSMNITGEDAKEYDGYTELSSLDKDTYGIMIALRKPS